MNWEVNRPSLFTHHDPSPEKDGFFKQPVFKMVMVGGVNSRLSARRAAMISSPSRSISAVTQPRVVAAQSWKTVGKGSFRLGL